MNAYSKICLLGLVCAAMIAVAFRLPNLQQRPMHTDEAVHAVKFGQLLEDGIYRYDKNEYHGPTLNYLTLIGARLTSADNITEINEFTLRIVPVFFGVLLVVMAFLLLDGLGPLPVIIAAILTAISPAMIAYSRYYIQEILLVCFTFAVIISGYRYAQSKKICWALLTGLFLGLMQTTKETWLIAFGSMALAAVCLVLLEARQKSLLTGYLKALNPRHILAAIATALVVSFVLYSSFFSNSLGFIDSFTAYSTYFSRAAGNTIHIHPWYYYLKNLIYFRLGGGPIWSEALLVLLACVGLVSAVTKKGLKSVDLGLVRFIALYTVIMTVVYSAIPYKTPWCMLGFLHGMILLAGVGASAIIKLIPNLITKRIVTVLLIIAAVHLAWQGYMANYKYYADPANPYVYAHTGEDIFKIVEKIEDISKVHPDGRNIYIQVICPGGDYWPLPWYLRNLTNIGWYSEVDVNSPAAPLIIASPAVETELIKKLYETPEPGKVNLYVPLFDSYTELRPQVELIGLITTELYNRTQQQPSNN